MKKTKTSTVALVLATIVFSATASSASFWVTGKINRTLADQNYAGCMIFLDKAIGGTCPGSWVSLDCKGLFNDKDQMTGKNKFSLALAAAQTGKTVSVYVNDANKANGYCVARRIDVTY